MERSGDGLAGMGCLPEWRYRDEKDIAYLVKPPIPPHHLATFSFILMVIGSGLAFLVTPAFGLVTGGCVIMSVLYSHDSFRWKSIPEGDLLLIWLATVGARHFPG